MSKSVILLFFILIPESFVIAQPLIDTMAIKNQLAEIYIRDQKTRTSSDSAAFMRYIDSTNLVMVESLIQKYGWPGRSFVGPAGNLTVFLVIQHADLAYQEKYFPMFQKSVEDGESRAIDLAYLEDRILMRQNKKQIYGTQVILNNTGGQEFYPIEDEANVNARRKKVGMPPIEEYAKNMGMEYGQ